MEHKKIPGLEFYEDAHIYLLHGNLVSGITSVLNKYLFPNKYKGITEKVMEHARNRGSRVHTEVQLGDSANIYVSEESKTYKRLIDESGLNICANELLVTDFNAHATAIDCVFDNGDDTVTIGDIKTTYALDEEYLKWQLSIGAMMYEACYGRKVTRMVAIWLPSKLDKAKIIDIERLPDHYPQQLLAADARADETFTCDIMPTAFHSEFPSNCGHLADEIMDYTEYINQLTEHLDGLKEQLKEQFAASGDEKWQNPYITVSRTKAHQRARLDTKKLQAEHEELYNQYVVYTDMAETINIKIK